MPTLLQIIASVIASLVVAAVTGLFAWLYRLDKKVSAVENKMVQIGETRFPKATDPKTLDFYDEARMYKGRREVCVPVRFTSPFKGQPKVIAALQKVDLGRDKSNANIHRIWVRAENPRPDGFDLYFETWEDSFVYDASASWVAVAQ